MGTVGLSRNPSLESGRSLTRKRSSTTAAVPSLALAAFCPFGRQEANGRFFNSPVVPSWPKLGGSDAACVNFQSPIYNLKSSQSVLRFPQSSIFSLRSSTGKGCPLTLLGLQNTGSVPGFPRRPQFGIRHSAFGIGTTAKTAKYAKRVGYGLRQQGYRFSSIWNQQSRIGKRAGRTENG